MSKLITKLPLKIMISILGLIVLGMVMGNMMLIYLGFIPVIYVAAGLYIQTPDKINVQGTIEEDEAYVEDRIKLDRTITVNEGIGPVVVHEKLPPDFALTEGSNLNLYWKGPNPLIIKNSHQFECTHRGIYEMGQVQIRSFHPFDLRAPQNMEHIFNQELIVKPKPSRVKRVRRRRQYSLFPIPSESKIKLGVQTSDFKEIREYNYGDPYKSINWKATARLNTIPGGKPTVNEYEREGRRVTWIFLDKSTRLNLGNSIKNSFEYAVQAATSLAEYYISRQCMVGLAEYVTHPKNDNDSPWFKPFTVNKLEKDESLPKSQMGNLIFPEAGHMQLYKIQRKLLAVDTVLGGMSLLQVVRHAKGHIHGTNPLFIIITNINQRSVHSLSFSIRELIKYTPRLRSQKTNIMIINISGYQLASSTDYERIAANALRFEEIELSSEIMSPGVMVINWDPTEQDIVQTVLNTVR
ncbi:DUF58 domain-containing protein [Candidatus Bathyarchaeota archaeon]|nr:DUF58 domain-containing protein [Candidatus Bathyarchaeota archaeon]